MNCSRLLTGCTGRSNVLPGLGPMAVTASRPGKKRRAPIKLAVCVEDCSGVAADVHPSVDQGPVVDARLTDRGGIDRAAVHRNLEVVVIFDSTTEWTTPSISTHWLSSAPVRRRGESRV